MTYKKWPDIIFTHNEHGDYEYKAHKAVDQTVRQVFDCTPWEIVCNDAKGFPLLTRQYYLQIPLNPKIIRRKEPIFRECYLSQQVLWEMAPQIVEWACSREIEVFGMA